MLEQMNGSGLTGFADLSQDSSQANQGLAPARTSLIWGVQETRLLLPDLG